MKKKFKTMAALCVCGCLILSGCETTGTGTTSTTQSQTSYADEDFIQSLAKGLEVGWEVEDQLIDEAKIKTSTEDGAERWSDAYIASADAELAEISKYKDAKFKDTTLRMKSAAYIKYVEQKKLLSAPPMNVTSWAQNEEDRYKLINEFAHVYGLTVSEEAKSKLSSVQNTADLINESSTQSEMIEEMFSFTSFDLVEESDGVKTYEATIANTTNEDLSDLTLDINLIDEDGIIVSTEHDEISNLPRWKRAKVSFKTEEDFTRTNVAFEATS